MTQSTQQQHRIGFFSSFFSIAVVLAILTLVNLIAIRNGFQWDVTSNKRFTLAPQTLQILEKLNSDVLVYSFYREFDEGYSDVKDLLEMYQTSSSRFSYRFADPDKDPLLARKYEINTYNTIVLEQDGRHRKVTEPTEQSLTNALIKLLQGDNQLTVCFSSGHGELDIESMESRGLMLLKMALQDANYIVETINLMALDTPPEKCDVLAVIGPAHDPVDEVIDWIRQYLSGGGRALIALEPGAQGKLADLMKEFGIQFNDNVIIDTKGFQNVLQPIVQNYPPHDITRDFDSGLVLQLAGPVSETSPPNEGWKVTRLALSGDNTYAKSDLKSLETGDIEYDPETDSQGPFPVIVACTETDIMHDADDPDRSDTRIIATGDADFMSNVFMQTFVAHQPFALNIFHWLSDEKELIAIPPRETISQPLLLQTHQIVAGFVIPVVLIPLGVAVTGIIRIISRRRRA